MNDISCLYIDFNAMVLPAGNTSLGSSISSEQIAMASLYENEQVEPNEWTRFILIVAFSSSIEYIYSI